MTAPSAPTWSTMPVSLAIIAPCPDAASVSGVMRVADRHRERVGGVRLTRSRSPATAGAPSAGPASFSAWPAPTTDFLTRLAEYSATGSPRSAGASSTTPRATPSFKVEAGFLLTKVSSTAASSGRNAFEHLADLAEQRDQPLGQRQVDRRMDDPVGDMGQPVAGHVDDPPAGMAQPGIEPENAHR